MFTDLRPGFPRRVNTIQPQRRRGGGWRGVEFYKEGLTGGRCQCGQTQMLMCNINQHRPFSSPPPTTTHTRTPQAHTKVATCKCAFNRQLEGDVKSDCRGNSWPKGGEVGVATPADSGQHKGQSGRSFQRFHSATADWADGSVEER